MAKDARFRLSLLDGAVLLTVVTFSVVAAAKLNKAGASSTTFKVGVTGQSGLIIEGETAELTVADDGSTVTLTIPLGNMDTGIGLRNEHTRKALEADQYPTTTLKVARSALKFPAAGADSSGDARGLLTLHGKTRDITFHYSAKNNGGAIAVRGTSRITMTDYGVIPPSYMGVTVKPDVDLNTSFSVTDN
jgi:polyisoprenoid-binding protein YceI